MMGIAGSLADLVGGARQVRVGDDIGPYDYDATLSMGLRGCADAVVLPRNREEVAAVVAWCYDHGVPIVPRGGGTGLAGGATPVHGGVVVSLERMRRIRSFEPLMWRMHVEAGVTTETVHRLARANGLYFPVDPGAGAQSHIGGNIATNAGGPHSFKYGVMRAWVTGIEAVLAPGQVATFGGSVRKDVAGYDLVGLLAGSEGTLGIITAAWLKLIPSPRVSLPVCAFFASPEAGTDAIERLLASGVVPAAIEYLDAATVRIAGRTFPGVVPRDGGFLVIADADGSKAEQDELLKALGAGALTPPSRELWAWRSGVSHAVAARRGGKLSDDVTVPLDRLAEAVEETVEIGRRNGLEACSWGHAGDGTLHSSFLLSPVEEAEVSKARAAAEELLDLAIRLGGTISGEHGIGILKNRHLAGQWNSAAVAAHQAVKSVLDPKGLLNPGKKLP